MKLYKYISPGLWNSILKDKLIRFTQPSSLNDPFEMMPHFKQFMDEDSLRKVLDETSPLEYDKLVIEQYEKLPDEVRALLPINSIPNPTFDEVLSLVQDFAGEALESFLPLARELLSENLNKHIGVLCLTEVPDHQVMWSYYAESHRGFVIELDSEHSYFNQRRTPVDEFGYLRKVKYENRPSVVLTSLDSTDVFFVKGKNWAHEQEWRMLRPLQHHTQILNKANEQIFLFSIPPECITGIILGAKMPKEIKDDITSFLDCGRQYAHTKVYCATLDEREYKLNVEPRRQSS